MVQTGRHRCPLASRQDAAVVLALGGANARQFSIATSFFCLAATILLTLSLVILRAARGGKCAEKRCNASYCYNAIMSKYYGYTRLWD